MSSAHRRAVAVLAGVLAAAAPAAAGSISISIGPRVALEDGSLVARVRISNGGDEAAHAVAPVLRFRDQQVRGEVRQQLGPGESAEPVLTLPVGDLGPGRWPYQLAVDYTDANQYPFQALHVGLLPVGSPPPAKVAVPGIEAEPVATTGNLRVRVKNLGGTERRAEVAVVVPEGVEATQAARDVTLAPWDEETITVPLVNRTALPGSRYPVFATVGYDDDGTHQAVVAQGMVEVRTAQSFLQTRQTALWIGAAVLFAAWLGFVAWWALGGRRAERRS